MIVGTHRFTWPKLGEAPEVAGVYAWYVRLQLGEADLTAFELAVEAAKREGKDPSPLINQMLGKHFFHPFQETAYTVRLSGALKPSYAGALAHEPTTSENLVARLAQSPERMRPIARVLNAAAPYFTAPLYIGMASNLRKRLGQHKERIIKLSNNPGQLATGEQQSGFAQQIVQRGFNPTQLFVECLVVDDIVNDEQVDLENILNRINFPIFGRN